MSLRRELKSYTVILNAYQHEIDRLSSDLAGIRAAQADVESRMQHLQHRADTEGFAVSIEAAPFVAGFLDFISDLDYPKNRIFIFLYSNVCISPSSSKFI